MVPTLVVATPLVYFLYREAGMRAPVDAGGVSRDIALAVGALTAGYLVGVVVTALLDVSALTGESTLARLVFRPDTVALAVFGILFLLSGGYLAATLVVEIPAIVETLATPLGLLLGLPLVLVWGGTVAVGKAVGQEPAAWVQFGAVAVGIALSVLWTVALATGVATVTEWG